MKFIKCNLSNGKVLAINAEHIALIRPSSTNNSCSNITMTHPYQSDGLRIIVVNEKYEELINKLQSL